MELEAIILKCPSCLTYRNHQTSKAPTKHKIPDHPWTKCTADLDRLQGHYYLLTVDVVFKVYCSRKFTKPLI